MIIIIIIIMWIASLGLVPFRSASSVIFVLLCVLNAIRALLCVFNYFCFPSINIYFEVYNIIFIYLDCVPNVSSAAWGERCQTLSLRQSFFCSLFPFHQRATKKQGLIDHRVKKSFFYGLAVNTLNVMNNNNHQQATKQNGENIGGSLLLLHNILNITADNHEI